jgi:RNA-binding protein
MGLSGFEKKYLRGLAHKLQPVVFVGQNGVTDAVLKTMDEALCAHELIKVKFVEAREKAVRRSLASVLETRGDAALIGMIGHVAIFYRPQPDPRKQRIKLPRQSISGTGSGG